MRMSDFASRRRLLQLAASSAAALWLPRSAWSQPRMAGDPFALGVASGSPTHDSVVLWTRLVAPELVANGEVTVRWELAHDAQFTLGVQKGQTHAVPALAHSVHVELQGLSPDHWYFYRFMVGDAVSATGRTRTFPAPDAVVKRMRLAYASCQHWQHGYFGAYRHMLAENLDMVLFLGDYLYEYPNSKTSMRLATGDWVLTLDDYRQRHALYKSDPDLQAMHQACPWLVTWDDHEVQNDYAGNQQGQSGAPVADFAARRAAAYQAFYEHMPIRASALTQAMAGLAGGAEMRIYSRARYGRLASLYMLDARQYKDPQACAKDGNKGPNTLSPESCADWNHPGRSMLGLQQERWLDAEFAKAGGQWNVLGQQTLLGQRDFRPGPGQLLWNDGWDGYNAARTRLTDSLQKYKADYADEGSAVVGVEFCGTSITSRSGGNDKTAARLAENPHFVFADAQRKGYGVVDFTPGRLTTTLRVVDDVRRPDAAVETLATFTVEAGRSALEKA